VATTDGVAAAAFTTLALFWIAALCLVGAVCLSAPSASRRRGPQAGRTLAYVYFKEEPGRRSAASPLTKDVASPRMLSSTAWLEKPFELSAAMRAACRSEDTSFSVRSVDNVSVFRTSCAFVAALRSSSMLIFSPLGRGAGSVAAS
jgi:hypothetical protein